MRLVAANSPARIPVVQSHHDLQFFVQLTFGEVGADRPRMAEIRALGALARFLRRQGKNRTFREPK
jgi:hypothetical protein